MESSPAQLSMPGPCSKHAPAWSTLEAVDLLGLWGKEAIQEQLRSNHRNMDIYEKFSLGMMKKGYQRDPQPCHVKVKDLRQAYQKAKEANSHSGAALQTCHFYTELHAILCDDPRSHVDTLEESQATTGNTEEEVLDKKEEEENGRQGIHSPRQPGAVCNPRAIQPVAALQHSRA